MMMMMMMMMSMSKDFDMDDLGVPPLTLDTPIFLITQGAQNHLAGQVTPGQLQTEAGWMDARAKTARTITSPRASPNGHFFLWLVVEPYPSEKYDLVSWDHDIPNIWQNKSPVPNHQSVMVNPKLLYFWAYWQTNGCFFPRRMGS